MENGCQLLEVHEDGAAGQPSICISNLFVVQKQPHSVVSVPEAAAAKSVEQQN